MYIMNSRSGVVAGTRNTIYLRIRYIIYRAAAGPRRAAKPKRLIFYVL